MSDQSEFGGWEKRMPPGTEFAYLGRRCVVLRYAGEAEARHGDPGYFGMVYEYSDKQGQIHRSCVAPRDLDAIMPLAQVGKRATEEYTIVTGGELGNLIQAVNRYTVAGWRPQGSLTITRGADGGSCYLQPMVREP